MEEPLIPWSLLKALHVIAMVAYFGGTFHLVRLFLAHRSALGAFEPERSILRERFNGMQRRALYRTVWPAIAAVLFTGVWLLWRQPGLLKFPFMHAKLGLVALLVAYHILVHRTHRSLEQGSVPWSGIGLQLLAHGVTALLFTLIVLILMRDRLTWSWGVMGLLVIGGLIGYAIRNARRKNEVGSGGQR